MQTINIRLSIHREIALLLTGIYCFLMAIYSKRVCGNLEVLVCCDLRWCSQMLNSANVTS